MSYCRLILALTTTLLLTACGSSDDQEISLQSEIYGTWEVVEEADQPVSRNGQRYTFEEDGTLRIFRPRPLGPTSTILAVYDFNGDTLSIRSDCDAGLHVSTIVNDTLVLAPIGTGRPLILVRTDDRPVGAAPLPPPPVATEDNVYTPPPDAPVDELPEL